MDEERSIVLSMVKEGRLTPQEAELLLEALETDLGDVSADPPALPAQRQLREPSHEQQPDWMTDLTAEQIIELKIHGVDAAFVQQARQLGLGNLSFEQLIELAVHGVDAAFVQQFRDMGLKDLPFKHLIKLAIHGVDAAYIKELYAAGFKDLSINQIVRMAAHGVDADFVREMRELDFKEASSVLLLDLKDRAQEACREDV